MSMERKKNGASLIGTKPGGTSPAIAGTRIRIALIADICRDFSTEKEAVRDILRAYPHLTREQVLAAIEYWHDHEAEIQAEKDEEERIIRELEASPPPWFRVLRTP